uniref:Uncharacterized protein n=1 Tax=Desulfovibrio sp. U5L TaxID=596152 RepID=I2Q5D9_9BACT
MKDQHISGELEKIIESLATKSSSIIGVKPAKVIPLLVKIEKNTRQTSNSGPSTSLASAMVGATSLPKFSVAEVDMVAAAVSRSVASAMATDRVATQRQAEKNIKATTLAQRKSDRALVQDQAKAGAGPKSAAALKERRQAVARPGQDSSGGTFKALLASSRGWLADKRAGVNGEATDLAAGATVGGPIWAALKELGEVAESAKDSLGHFKKSTDKATTSTGKAAAVRGQGGRYAAQRDQKEERRHGNLLSAIRKIRPGVGGGGGGGDSGGGLLDDVDDVMDIWGHAKQGSSTFEMEFTLG